MKITRRKLPLWRWDPFLLAVVLGLSVVAAVFQRLDLPVVTPIALTILLAVALAAAICLVLPFFVPRLRRDGEGTLTLTPDIELRAIDTDDTVPVTDDRRHRGSIDAALAGGGPDFIGVLVPGATIWMRRDLRVAVDLQVRGRLHRAGYLPREIDQRVAEVLAPLAAQNRYVTVPVSIRTRTKTRTITVGIGPDLTGPANG